MLWVPPTGAAILPNNRCGASTMCEYLKVHNLNDLNTLQLSNIDLWIRLFEWSSYSESSDYLTNLIANRRSKYLNYKRLKYLNIVNASHKCRGTPESRVWSKNNI